MTKQALLEKLTYLRSLPGETEIVEFKEANNNYDFNKLGKYFSSLSNEANLKSAKEAWLIFGIQDKDHKIVGTNFRKNREDLDNLKSEIANKTTNRITFIEIFELSTPEGRVILFQIPPAPKGIPLAWEGYYYGRDGEELSPLNLEEIERIRNQSITVDWSADIIPEATINDLDVEAIALARKNYINKFPELAVEIAQWDNTKFLNKAKITQNGKITRTAIILLGKSESEYLINPGVSKIRWILKDSKGTEKDYQTETCPFIFAVDKIYAKIRNTKYRYLKDSTLFPEEVLTYEPFVLREAINNCIAHQDYSKGGMINVVEMEDRLIFTNLGSFIPGSVEKVVIEDAPQEYYRNKFLSTAMSNLKMVDTIGSGIRKMFNYQRERFFPMPDYDLSADRVKTTIIGKVLDIEYARQLARNPDLNLEEIILLDKVQKKKKLTQYEEKHLRKSGLIEGRKPNFYISKGVAQKTGLKADYTKNKALEKKYYLDLILKALEQHGSLNRADIDKLLWNKLPDWMDDIKKKNKITNLLSELRLNNKIRNIGSDYNSKWILI